MQVAVMSADRLRNCILHAGFEMVNKGTMTIGSRRGSAPANSNSGSSGVGGASWLSTPDEYFVLPPDALSAVRKASELWENSAAAAKANKTTRTPVASQETKARAKGSAKGHAKRSARSKKKKGRSGAPAPKRPASATQRRPNSTKVSSGWGGAHNAALWGAV